MFGRFITDTNFLGCSMQLRNYLICLAVTLSICIVAIAMSNRESVTLMQPVIPDEEYLVPVTGKPVQFTQLKGMDMHLVNHKTWSSKPARTGSPWWAQKSASIYHPTVLKNQQLNAAKARSSHPTWESKRVHASSSPWWAKGAPHPHASLKVTVPGRPTDSPFPRFPRSSHPPFRGYHHPLAFPVSAHPPFPAFPQQQIPIHQIDPTPCLDPPSPPRARRPPSRNSPRWMLLPPPPLPCASASPPPGDSISTPGDTISTGDSRSFDPASHPTPRR
mmetsp:Transcript_8082/g.17256  ORF Transcript_8082/g.17256 Transcript_8082/m.17256 type:complete len:275 (-) Transcript_8082:333-1157(-)